MINDSCQLSESSVIINDIKLLLLIRDHLGINYVEKLFSFSFRFLVEGLRHISSELWLHGSEDFSSFLSRHDTKGRLSMTTEIRSQNTISTKTVFNENSLKVSSRPSYFLSSPVPWIYGPTKKQCNAIKHENQITIEVVKVLLLRESNLNWIFGRNFTSRKFSAEFSLLSQIQSAERTCRSSNQICALLRVIEIEFLRGASIYSDNVDVFIDMATSARRDSICVKISLVEQTRGPISLGNK